MGQYNTVGEIDRVRAPSDLIGPVLEVPATTDLINRRQASIGGGVSE